MYGLPNLHSVYYSGHPLGVECAQPACRHRALLPHEVIRAHAGNMDYVRDLKLRCSACGGREFTFKIFVRVGEPDAWLAEPVEPKSF